MKRVFAVIELSDEADFDPGSDDDLDTMAEDLLHIAGKVQSVAVFPSLGDLVADLGVA